MRTVLQFLVSYVVSVIVATFTLFAIAIGYDATQALSGNFWSHHTLLSFGLIGLGIAIIALIPAISATVLDQKGDQRKPTLRFAWWGFWTGLLAALAVAFLSTNMDVSDEWMWRAILNQSGTILSFGVSGLLAGLTFGVIRRRVSRTI